MKRKAKIPLEIFFSKFDNSKFDEILDIRYIVKTKGCNIDICDSLNMNVDKPLNTYFQ